MINCFISAQGKTVLSTPESENGKIAVELEEAELAAGGLAADRLHPGRYAVFSVSDNGCGMDETILDQIFEPHFTTKEAEGGSGIGLSVVKSLVEKHQGAVEVKSQIGQGATFYVYLPLIVQEEALPAEAAWEEIKMAGGTECILLVDDDESVLTVNKHALERFGYRVTETTSSKKAAEIFKADPLAFDLVITDMTMPGMTGEQLAKELFACSPSLPVIICTGFSDRSDLEKARHTGVRGFLTKPVPFNEMARTVRRLLDENLSQGC